MEYFSYSSLETFNKCPSLFNFRYIDKILKKAWDQGIILTGASAGMICWFESSVTDSYGPLKELKTGLGFIKGSACPHFDGEIHRRPTYENLIKSINELDLEGVEILPQTMAPYPWHFGGQRYQNLFMDIKEIVDFNKKFFSNNLMLFAYSN